MVKMGPVRRNLTVNRASGDIVFGGIGSLMGYINFFLPSYRVVNIFRHSKKAPLRFLGSRSVLRVHLTDLFSVHIYGLICSGLFSL